MQGVAREILAVVVFEIYEIGKDIATKFNGKLLWSILVFNAHNWTNISIFMHKFHKIIVT